MPPRQPTQALVPADELATPLGRRVAAAEPAANLSGFRVVSSGTDALATLELLADQATRTIDLQYYIVENDPSVRALLQHVRAAADRGVRVRMLVDDMNSAGNDDAFRRLTDHPKIEVRLFNPLPGGRFSTITKVMSSLTDIDRINRRMHNKMFVVDNAMAFTGGRNLGDSYFLQSKDANFVDMDLVVAGHAVQALSRSFDRYWNSELSFPITALVPHVEAASAASADQQLDAPANVDPTVGLDPSAAAWEIAPTGHLKLQWAPARLLADKPAKIEDQGEATPDETMFDDVATLMRSAQHELIVISPYLVPGKNGMAIFKELRARGVEVRILTSSLAATDAPIVQDGYARYRKPMLKDGIHLYELKPEIGAGNPRIGAFGKSQARLHAKVMVVDGQYLLVGSMNLDQRSMNINSEMALLVHSPDAAEDVRKLFAEVARTSSYRLELQHGDDLRWVSRGPNGAEVSDESEPEPESSLGRRLTFWLLEPFAPEEML